MSMDYRGKSPFRWKRFAASFGFAFQGMRFAWRESNFRFHAAAASAVIAAGSLLSLSRIEWLFILLMIFGMFVLEMINTAIEKVVDLVTEETHPLAGMAKDLAAGAVLLYAILAAITGLIIFLPKVWPLW